MSDFLGQVATPGGLKVLRMDGWLKTLETHHFTLRDQLASVELRNNTLEHFVDDGGEDAFVIIHAKLSVD